MTTAQNHLVSEFGRTVGLPGLELDREGRIVLTFDGLALTLEALPARDAFLLYGTVGSLPSSAGSEVRLRLWKAGTASALSGAGSIGLDDDGSVLLIETLDGRDLDGFRLQLAAAVGRMRDWQRRVADIAAAPGGSGPESFGEAMSMIRA